MTGVKKIVVIGGESTGKSTLCEQLSEHYRTVWVPEYARQFLTNLKQPYEYEHLLQIAKGQIAAEDHLLPLARQFLFCDTDLHVIKIWSEHKFQRCAPFILHQIQRRHYDAYLITAPDFPWQDDPLREHPATEMRSYFFKLYCEIIAETGKPFLILEGSEQQRLAGSIGFINRFATG